MVWFNRATGTEYIAMTDDKGLAVALMVHDSCEAVRSLVAYLLKHGIIVVVHVDRKSPALCLALREEFENQSGCSIISEISCDWGGWSLVEAEVACYKHILDRYKSVRYVSFMSGADIPIRPLAELEAFLRDNIDDFIECVDITRHDFVICGPQIERFKYWWFFNYINSRYLFNLLYNLQGRFRIRRSLPLSMTPCMGGQFKTLKVETISSVLALLQEHPKIVNYFKYTWIPDESFFPTLVNYLYEGKAQRGHLNNSLTYRLFNRYGRPQTFYADNLDKLNTREFWFARKFDTELVENIESTCQKVFQVSRHDEDSRKRINDCKLIEKNKSSIVRSSTNSYYILVEPEEISIDAIRAVKESLDEEINFMGGLDTDRYNDLVKEITIDIDLAIFDQWQYFKPLSPEQYVGNLYKTNCKNVLFTIDLNSLHLPKYKFLRESPSSLFVFPRYCSGQKYRNAKAWLEKENVSTYEV